MSFEQQVNQELASRRVEVGEALTRQMLSSAHQQCFRMCFHSGTPNVHSSSSATAVSSSVTKPQEQCLSNCLEKFLAAREIAFKQATKHM